MSKLPENHPARRYKYHLVESTYPLPGLDRAYVLFNSGTRNVVDGHHPRSLEEAMRAAFTRDGGSREARPIVVYQLHQDKADRAGALRGVIDVTEEELQAALRAKRLIDALYALADPTAVARTAADETGHAPCRTALDEVQDAAATAMAEALAYYAVVGMERRIGPWNPFATEARRLVAAPTPAPGAGVPPVDVPSGETPAPMVAPT